MNNMDIYNNVREVPPEAQKEITGGRLKGMTDINPMWRIKQLTEQFGPCGQGWKYKITDKQFVTGGKDEVSVFVEIDLYYKVGDGWSEPIPGTGGSMFVENQQRGPYVNDECIKMALTDAISVACKALGFGADIYWQKDRTKYGKEVDYDAEIKPEDIEHLGKDTEPGKENNGGCEECGVEMTDAQKTISENECNRYLCVDCRKKLKGVA